MFIQINTDSNIASSSALDQQVETIVMSRLGHFSAQITRVEVHLSDENSDKKVGTDAKRCLLVVDLAGLQPIEVSDHASTLEQAVAGAAQKMQHSLDSTLGRLGSR